MALKNKSHDHDKVSAPRRAPQQKAQTSNEHQRPVKPALALKRAASERPSALRPADILALQRTVGNRAVERILNHQPHATPPQPSTPANAVQRKTEEEETLQGKPQTGERKENRTGLPDNLKAGIENLSGMAMDDVKVHYNSSAPAEVDALAYTQGTDIHMGPGEEQHLPHEAWHVVQQKQGRVKPTLQAKGVAINDDQGLEQEADVMGVKALQTRTSFNSLVRHKTEHEGTKNASWPTPLQLAASTRKMTAKQVVKAAMYTGGAYTGPEGSVMMRSHPSKIDNKSAHFSQYQANYDAKATYKVGKEVNEIFSEIFDGPSATKCHHITLERVEKKGSKDNARYFKSDTWHKGNIAENEDTIKESMKTALGEERTRIVKAIERLDKHGW